MLCGVLHFKPQTSSSQQLTPAAALEATSASRDFGSALEMRCGPGGAPDVVSPRSFGAATARGRSCQVPGQMEEPMSEKQCEQWGLEEENTS